MHPNYRNFKMLKKIKAYFRTKEIKYLNSSVSLEIS